MKERWSLLIWLVLALIIFIYQALTILILEFRSPTKTVAWLMILFIFPIIGFVMYYFLAKEYNQKRKVRRKGFKVTEETRLALQDRTLPAAAPEEVSAEFRGQTRLFGLLANMPDSPITTRNASRILTDGKEVFPAMLEAIREAKDHVHLEFYTIRHDTIGGEFRDLLIAKMKEGVRVRILYDGVGSYELDPEYVRRLEAEGAEVKCFLPPLIALFDKRINYRNHRKLLIVDGRTAFLGGLNIGDEYRGWSKRYGYWRDTFVQLWGDSVHYAQHVFLTDWKFVSGQALTDLALFYPPSDGAGEERVQLIACGPDANWDGVFEMVFGAVSAAKERIYIATPYFIPDRSLNVALRTAAISGVDVRLIVPGVPDTKFVYWATTSYVEEMLQAGVRVYRFLPGFIHAKVLLVDRLLASVGTANMDMRSFFSNFEINAVLYGEKAIGRLEADFMRDLEASREIVLEEFEQRPRTQKGKEILARMLSPLL